MAGGIKAMASGIQGSLAVILPWHMVHLFFVISEDEQATWLLQPLIISSNLHRINKAVLYLSMTLHF